MILVSFGIQILATPIWHGMLEPQNIQKDRASYHSPALRLDPGIYNLSLRLRQPRKFLEISLQHFPVKIHSPENPDFHLSGSLKYYKERRSTGRRTLHDDFVAEISEPFNGTFMMEIRDAGATPLSFSVQKASMDHRLLLWPGMFLLVLAFLVDPAMRKSLFGLISTDK